MMHSVCVVKRAPAKALSSNKSVGNISQMLSGIGDRSFLVFVAFVWWTGKVTCSTFAMILENLIK